MFGRICFPLLLMMLGTPAAAQPVFVPQTTLLCETAAAVRLLKGASPPGLVAFPDHRLLRLPRNLMLSPKTSLVQVGQDQEVARVRMTGRPMPLYVLQSNLVAGVGGTPTPSADPEGDQARQAKQAYEQFFTTVKQRLSLAPVQQPLFDAYAQAVLDQQAASLALDRRFALELPLANALRRLQLRQEGMQFEADRLRTLVALFGRFYMTLTADQRVIADKLIGRNG